MKKLILLLVTGAVAWGCASRGRGVAPIAIEPRCEAISDTLSKYVSSDALPVATFTGDVRDLRSGAPGGVTAVNFVVRPDGSADPSTVELTGADNPGYEQNVVSFAARNRFVPAQVDGCNVLSRYTLVLR